MPTLIMDSPVNMHLVMKHRFGQKRSVSSAHRYPKESHRMCYEPPAAVQ